MKENINKVNYFKIENFCSLKDTVRKTKPQVTRHHESLGKLKLIPQ